MVSSSLEGRARTWCLSLLPGLGGAGRHGCRRPLWRGLWGGRGRKAPRGRVLLLVLPWGLVWGEAASEKGAATGRWAQGDSRRAAAEGIQDAWGQPFPPHPERQGHRQASVPWVPTCCILFPAPNPTPAPTLPGGSCLPGPPLPTTALPSALEVGRVPPLRAAPGSPCHVPVTAALEWRW